MRRFAGAGPAAGGAQRENTAQGGEKWGRRRFGVKGEEEGGERGRASPRPSLTPPHPLCAQERGARKERAKGGGGVVARPGRMRGAPPRAAARAGAPCR